MHEMYAVGQAAEQLVGQRAGPASNFLGRQAVAPEKHRIADLRLRPRQQAGGIRDRARAGQALECRFERGEDRKSVV